MENKTMKKSYGENLFREWPTKRVAVEKLKPYERNPRKISPAGYAKLKDKIMRLGFSAPIIATHDLRIIGGHQRLKVLQELGVEEIDVKCAPFKMTDAQFREAMIESNVSDGEWDVEMLAEDFEEDELKDYGIDDKTSSQLKRRKDIAKEITETGTGFYVLIEINDESQQQELFDEFQNRGLKCKLMN